MDLTKTHYMLTSRRVRFGEDSARRCFINFACYEFRLGGENTLPKIKKNKMRFTES